VFRKGRMIFIVVPLVRFQQILRATPRLIANPLKPLL